MSDFRFDKGPAPEVLRFFEEKKLQPSFDWRDVWAEEHAVAFTVAKTTGFDVLEDIREELDAALREGLPFAEFRKRLEPRLKAKGWWGRKEVIDPKTGEVVRAQLGSRRRLRTIYQANVRTARAAGQWERAQRTKRMLPYFEYRLGPSRKHRQKHVAWAMAPTILPVDDPTWDALYPPNGWGCKCWLRQISKREAARLGGPTEPPPITWREYRNPRDGRIYRIPDGIDPGWHTNPGKARWRMRGALRRMGERVAVLPPEWTLPAIRAMVRSPLFARLARGEAPKAVMLPVAVVPEWLRKEVGTDASLMIMSGETAIKQIKHHETEFKDVDLVEMYAAVQEALDDPDVVLQDDERFFAIHKELGLTSERRPWRISFKVTVDGMEIFLRNMHPLNERTERQYLNRAIRILRSKRK